MISSSSAAAPGGLCPQCPTGAPNWTRLIDGVNHLVYGVETSDGYFKNGDMGEWVASDEGYGYLRLVGRAKDLIITGGLNVYPLEVEERIDSMDGVVESAVIGLPDHDLGEAVAAVVVPAPGHALTERAIIGALRDEIATFKVPKRVFFADDLPRNAMGKVQKNVLRSKYSTL